MTEPTDAELGKLAEECGIGWGAGLGGMSDFLGAFARAVLTKWGQPAHSGEPVAWLSPWRADQVTTDYDAYGERGIPLYTAPQPAPTAQSADSVQEDAAREAIEKVLALFPFNVPIQKFTVNNGPCLTADNDDEFYSVKRVLAFLTEIKTTLDAAHNPAGSTPVQTMSGKRGRRQNVIARLRSWLHKRRERSHERTNIHLPRVRQ